MMDRFYVYLIYNPWSGRPVYVGKGQGRRAREHLTGERTNPDVVEFMRKCRQRGRKPDIRYDREGVTEAEALQREKALIKRYGRKDNGTGILLNRTDGGRGVSDCMPRAKLDPTDRIVVLLAGKSNLRRMGSGRWHRYQDILRSKTVGAFLAKHPRWESTLNHYVARGWIEIRARAVTQKT
jgi:hypothetical protein